MLPYAKELDVVPVPKPVLDQVIGPVRILVTGYIRTSSSGTEKGHPDRDPKTGRNYPW